MSSTHGCWLSNPTLVGISKVTLHKSLGLPQYKRNFKNKVRTKRCYIYKIIIPEQIVENPNFKPILVVKEWPTFLFFFVTHQIYLHVVYCHNSKFLTIKFI